MKVKLDEGAFLPERAHAQDAGYDLRTPKDFYLKPYGFMLIDTGVHIQLPPGTCAVLKSKSGLYCGKQIISTGLVDEGYTGSIRVGLANLSGEHRRYKCGDKISQFVVVPILTPELEVVDELDTTERGDGGFGSTGR